MASETDIYNLALSHLGDVADVSDPDEQSMQAQHCRRFYPIARDAALEMGDWDFATRRISPALVDSPPPSSYLYAYALPASCLKARAVFDVAFGEINTQDFIIESIDDGTRILYTNLAEATLRYTVKVTDTTRFSPLFLDALGFLLASYLAGPIIKGQEGIAAGRAAYTTFTAQIINAKSSVANQQQQPQIMKASAIDARRGAWPADYPFPGDR